MPLVPQVRMFLYILTDPTADIALIQTEIDTFVKTILAPNEYTDIKVTSTIGTNLARQELNNQGEVLIQDESGHDQCVSGEHFYMIVTVSYNTGNLP